MRGGDACHLIKRCDEAVASAVDLRTFTERIDAFIDRLHLVIDDNAAIDSEARLFGHLRVRPDADSHHHKIGWNFRTVFKAYGFNLAVACDLFCIGTCENTDAAILKRFFQQIAGRTIELSFHQRRHQMNDRHRHALHLQTGGSFKTQQTATDHDRMATALCGEQHGMHIVEVTIGENARKIVAGHRNDNRHRTCSDHQLIVRSHFAMLGTHGALCTVNLDDLVALVEHDATLDVPAVPVNDNFFKGFLTGKHWRQQNTVIVDARFRVEDRDVVAVRRDLV